MSVAHLYTRAYSTSIGGGRVMSVGIVQDKLAKRHWLRRDVHARGRPESCLYAQPAGLHGEDPDGKKGNRKKWLPRKMGTGIEKN